MGYEPNHVTIKAADKSVVCLTQPRGTLGYHVQYGLNIGRRTCDHTKDFACGSLLLQRLTEFRVRRFELCSFILELLEQPHVLDGDHRLVGERSYEIDLLIGKTIDFVSPKGKYSDHNAVAQERDPQQGAITFNTLLFLQPIVRVSKNILNLNRATFQRHPAGYGAAIISRERVSTHELFQLSNGGVRSCQVVLATV
jgi:hypothetical protein